MNKQRRDQRTKHRTMERAGLTVRPGDTGLQRARLLVVADVGRGAAAALGCLPANIKQDRDERSETGERLVRAPSVKRSGTGARTKCR